MRSRIHALFRLFVRYPIIPGAIIAMLLTLWIIDFSPDFRPPDRRIVNAADSLTPTDTVTPLPGATITPLGSPPVPTNTPDPFATATPGGPPPTATPIPAPPTTIVGNYTVTPAPLDLAISPTSESGTCAEGHLAAVTITNIGTDPISWNASADQGVDLNPSSSASAGQNPMTPGQSQRMGFSFGAALPPGTIIHVMVQQTLDVNPPQTTLAGTVTITCT